VRSGAITAFAGVEDAWELRQRGGGGGGGGAAHNSFHALRADAEGGWHDVEEEAAKAAIAGGARKAARGVRDNVTDEDRAHWAAARFFPPQRDGGEDAARSATPLWERAGASAADASDENDNERSIPGDGAWWDAHARPALLLIAYNRPRYLAETLRSLAGVSRLRSVAVFVSQDGDDAGVAAVADAFGGVPMPESAERAEEEDEEDAAAVASLLKEVLRPGDAGSLAPPHTSRFARWRHPRAADSPSRRPAAARPPPAHIALAAHYRWALDAAFGAEHDGHNASHVIIAEDDMLFSPDFITLFAATAPLLAADASLWCVSSWNDNGATGLLADVAALRRTSFFPGLGWMLTRHLWAELAPRWPGGNWDHWMRSDDVARGRECVVPQVPRTLNIGRRGANMQAWLYDKRLAGMGYAASDVASFGDVSYLLRSRYAARLGAAVRDAPRIAWAGRSREELTDDARAASKQAGLAPPAALLLYVSEQYERLAALFGAPYSG
jgi:hypothetical protein